MSRYIRPQIDGKHFCLQKAVALLPCAPHNEKIKFLSDTEILKQCILLLSCNVTPDTEILDTKGVVSLAAHTRIQSYNQRQLDSLTKIIIKYKYNIIILYGG